MPGSFVHLHNHTEYSLLDGAVHIKDLIAECSRMGMPAVAVTDHGNLFGAIELVMETNSLNKSVAAWNKEHPEGPRKQEVKPIFGCEVYLSPTPISVKKQLPGRRKYTHLLCWRKMKPGGRIWLSWCPVPTWKAFIINPAWIWKPCGNSMRASSVVQHALPDRLMSGCSMTSLKKQRKPFWR